MLYHLAASRLTAEIRRVRRFGVGSDKTPAVAEETA